MKLRREFLIYKNTCVNVYNLSIIHRIQCYNTVEHLIYIYLKLLKLIISRNVFCISSIDVLVFDSCIHLLLYGNEFC